MSLILNIGLDSKVFGTITPQFVILAFDSKQDHIKDFRIVESSTERTVVVELQNLVSTTPHQLAIMLGQECIPSWDDELEASGMHGPAADSWGQFDPDQFYLPTGETLLASWEAEFMAK